MDFSAKNALINEPPTVLHPQKNAVGMLDRVANVGSINEIRKSRITDIRPHFFEF